MSTRESVYKQHEENIAWRNQLAFYKDEISILEGRLEELISNNSHEEVVADIEKYQNQLIVQRNNIDEIEHLINVNEDALHDAIHGSKTADKLKLEYHSKEKELVESFEKNFEDLREEFNHFVSKWR